MRKLAIIAAATIGFAAPIVLIALMMLPAQSADFDRISKGMTMAEVEEILGEPTSVERVEFDDIDWLLWRLGDGAHISVYFRNNRVHAKQWHSRQTQTFFDKIRHMFD